MNDKVDTAIKKVEQFADDVDAEGLDHERLAPALYVVLNEIDTLRTQNEIMREALLPFTHPDLREILSGNFGGGESIVFVRNKATLKIKDFRNVADAIANNAKR